MSGTIFHFNINHLQNTFFRLQNISGTSPVLQSTTQYGTEKRTFNDDFVFKVSNGKIMNNNNVKSLLV